MHYALAGGRHAFGDEVERDANILHRRRPRLAHGLLDDGMLPILLQLLLYSNVNNCLSLILSILVSII